MTSIAIVGHLVLDHIFVEGMPYIPTVGGVPTYAGLAAAKMGSKVKVVSKVGESLPEERLRWLANQGLDLSGVRRLKGVRTTSFEIRYDGNEREMRLLEKGEPITPGDVPPAIDVDGILLGPVASEIPLETVELLSGLAPCLSLDPQGFLRRFGDDSTVSESKGFDLRILRFVKILKATRKELSLLTGYDDPHTACEFLRTQGPEVVIATGGSSDTILTGNDETIEVPSWPSRVVDPTGAGDAFLGAFLAEYLNGGELAWCARVGVASASFVVEGYGPSRFGSREEVCDRAGRLSIDLKR